MSFTLCHATQQYKYPYSKVSCHFIDDLIMKQKAYIRPGTLCLCHTPSTVSLYALDCSWPKWKAFLKIPGPFHKPLTRACQYSAGMKSFFM